ncbi:uncharacterized protein LOC117100824 [Anneissia japonica]|uniref:uncharacterized protein LOC117100824 n=1 Tax=Anneissia japonica TaxID=1529436 RepID=UPI001425AA18|nr:uncharacterized protein LOC117100824 [Anneissia japonica]
MQAEKTVKMVPLTPAEPIPPNWPNGDFGLLLSVKSSCGDGLMKIGKLINEEYNIRAVDFTGYLSNSKCTRVHFQQCGVSDADSVTMKVRMIDPLDEGVSPAEDRPNDYTYKLVVIDGKLCQREGQLLVAVKDIPSNKNLDEIKCEDFLFKLYNYLTWPTDDSVMMSVTSEQKTWIASDNTGQVIMMSSQLKFNNPFLEMRIIDEGRIDESKSSIIRHPS